MKPNLYFTVNASYSPDLITRVKVKADTPLDVIKQAHIHYPNAIWFTVIGTKIMSYARCCAHCVMCNGFCVDFCRKGCPNNMCEDSTCSGFKPESQTD